MVWVVVGTPPLELGPECSLTDSRGQAGAVSAAQEDKLVVPSRLKLYHSTVQSGFDKLGWTLAASLRLHNISTAPEVSPSCRDTRLLAIVPQLMLFLCRVPVHLGHRLRDTQREG